MSVIVRDAKGKLLLLCKGADRLVNLNIMSAHAYNSDLFSLLPRHFISCPFSLEM